MPAVGGDRLPSHHALHVPPDCSGCSWQLWPSEPGAQHQPHVHRLTGTITDVYSCGSYYKGLSVRLFFFMLCCQMVPVIKQSSKFFESQLAEQCDVTGELASAIVTVKEKQDDSCLRRSDRWPTALLFKH